MHARNRSFLLRRRGHCREAGVARMAWRRRAVRRLAEFEIPDLYCDLFFFAMMLVSLVAVFWRRCVGRCLGGCDTKSGWAFHSLGYQIWLLRECEN
jgi:hypothetical protein